MSNEQIHNHGVGFFSMLTVLFIGLKLTGVITWSWLLVLFPLWFPSVIYAMLYIICVIVALL